MKKENKNCYKPRGNWIPCFFLRFFLRFFFSIFFFPTSDLFCVDVTHLQRYKLMFIPLLILYRPVLIMSSTQTRDSLISGYTGKIVKQKPRLVRVRLIFKRSADSFPKNILPDTTHILGDYFHLPYTYICSG